MSPPTLSQGPTLDMTNTSFGPQSSKASYSGDSPPGGLSAWMSGRWGTKFSVTARPAHFWPGANERAPSMCAPGQPMTHKPSMSAWVESEPSFSIISSLTLPPEAGPVARVRRVRALKAAGRRVAVRRSMIVVCCYLVLFVAVVRCAAACARSSVGTARLTIV